MEWTAQMKIALIAHDSKKMLLTEFCVAYKHVLADHKLCATATTGNHIAGTANLKVQLCLTGLTGVQQIAAMVSCNEVDLVIFFRDPYGRKEHEPDEKDLLRLCDAHTIPVATNIATAEALILALQRGDLDWRTSEQKLGFDSSPL
jgi:methylglyoxal synthase